MTPTELADELPRASTPGEYAKLIRSEYTELHDEMWLTLANWLDELERVRGELAERERVWGKLDRLAERVLQVHENQRLRAELSTQGADFGW